MSYYITTLWNSIFNKLISYFQNASNDAFRIFFSVLSEIPETAVTMFKLISMLSLSLSLSLWNASGLYTTNVLIWFFTGSYTSLNMYDFINKGILNTLYVWFRSGVYMVGVNLFFHFVFSDFMRLVMVFMCLRDCYYHTFREGGFFSSNGIPFPYMSFKVETKFQEHNKNPEVRGFVIDNNVF